MLNHLSIAYSLSNIYTKNYWNRTTIVEIIVGGWVVPFFETHYIYNTEYNTTATWCTLVTRHCPLAFT